MPPTTRFATEHGMPAAKRVRRGEGTTEQSDEEPIMDCIVVALPKTRSSLNTPHTAEKQSESGPAASSVSSTKVSPTNSAPGQHQAQDIQQHKHRDYQQQPATLSHVPTLRQPSLHLLPRQQGHEDPKSALTQYAHSKASSSKPDEHELASLEGRIFSCSGFSTETLRSQVETTIANYIGDLNPVVWWPKTNEKIQNNPGLCYMAMTRNRTTGFRKAMAGVTIEGRSIEDRTVTIEGPLSFPRDESMYRLTQDDWRAETAMDKVE
ncbi:hypothetical protein GGR57DRAFT_465372 [Xylariaceae sp. FL1272]|nr:hypothetical protein GGR57DRAFT_465372 [Xylariaceae sp. FL1272]